jgi:hypothetical protein
MRAAADDPIAITLDDPDHSEDERRFFTMGNSRESIREHCCFSNGISGKYAGKVHTTDVRHLTSTKPVERRPAANVTNGSRRLDDRDRDLDSELRHKRGDTLAGR